MSSKDEISYLFEAEKYPEDFFSLEKAFGNRPIILYGAGESSIWFFEIVTNLFGYTASLVLDKKFTEGDFHEGVKANSPDNYIPSPEEQKIAVVVICSGKLDHQIEMFANVVQLGFQNIIPLRDIYEIHNPFSQPNSLQTQGFDYYQHHKEEICLAYELFDDEESKSVYHKFLQTHMQRKPIFIPDRPRNEQYFPKDIKLNRGYSNFVSCGAYDGDTIRQLNRLHGKVDEIVCLEAEPKIYARLNEYLSQHGASVANKITSLPCAAYSHESIMKFTSSTGLGSRLSEKGDCVVQAVALDHVLPTMTPSFISMDIEGAEPYALLGAEQMIRKNGPDLGICVYHSPNHLWEIPHYLHSLDMGYRFYLRNYTSFAIETVVYATI